VNRLRISGLDETVEINRFSRYIFSDGIAAAL
jgi:hypothetical protein